MTQGELETDLNSKISHKSYHGGILYFDAEILGTKERRRSFNDLIEHYKHYSVTEEMLMKAIKNLKLGGYYCPTPRRIVFFKIEPEGKTFWVDSTRRNTAKEEALKKNNNFDKYTPEYLEKLYDSI